MQDSALLKLKYTGSDVKEGTMSVTKTRYALEGIEGAFTKIANIKGFENNYDFRLIGINKGSFEIVISAWSWIGNNANQIEVIAATATAIGTVGTLITSVIAITKHTEKQPFRDKINVQNGTVVITNIQNATAIFPQEAYEIFRQKTVAPDLSKIAEPLEEDKIDKAELITQFDSSKVSEDIMLEEKPYFTYEKLKPVHHNQIKLKGRFNSLTKTTNKGQFILEDGRRIPYIFITADPTQLYSEFAYNGLVEINCLADFNADYELMSIKILSVTKLQQDIFQDK